MRRPGWSPRPTRSLRAGAPRADAGPFFFSRYGHHRDLHSFPTRRSSDLRRVADEPLHPFDDHQPREPVSIECVKDRKSTRLNSSHSQISYAVFCLKKKKKTYSNSAPVACVWKTSSQSATVSTYVGPLSIM